MAFCLLVIHFFCYCFLIHKCSNTHILLGCASFLIKVLAFGCVFIVQSKREENHLVAFASTVLLRFRFISRIGLILLLYRVSFFSGRWDLRKPSHIYNQVILVGVASPLKQIVGRFCCGLAEMMIPGTAPIAIVMMMVVVVVHVVMIMVVMVMR